ncbi:retrovirus-related pol polyprotein from transposon TNT 1-94 [Tanacetum coccineum]
MDAEQAFWLRISNPTSKPSDASPVKIEAPKELPKVSLVNESLKKLKFHLARFDNVVKIRTTPDARTEGEWGFEHTKAVFNNEIIPFLKSLKDIFNVFDRDLLNEIMEVQTVFNQMDAAVQQFSVDKQCLKIAKKELLLENDRLLQQIMSQEVLLTVMNSMSLIGESVNMDGKRKETCNLEAELLKSQNAFNDLLKRHSQLEKHCISLECSIQLNQEVFQKRESYDNQNALEIPEFFAYTDLKAHLLDKDSTIYKLKDIIKSLREKSKEENVNYDDCEIETKNVELENSVAKLLSENERLCNEINHVKQVFKEQFDSIKKTRVCSKEQSDSLIDKLNLKSAKNEDLKAQIQDKVFVITSLKNDLRKLKRKEIVDIDALTPSAHTIVPGMFKLDLEPLALRLLQNREIHIEYLKYTQEQADILRGILLVYVRDTCPNVIKLNEKKVVVTPKNKVKKVRFDEPLTSNSKQVESSKTSYSNTPVLSSTGLKCSTSKCGSKPTGNKRNDRISQISSRNIKIKVEAQPKKVNKKNCVVERIRDDNVKHYKINVNSDLNYATCKKSLFDDVHDKSNIVPPKKTTSNSVETQKPELKVYSKKPNKNVGSSKKVKIVESKNANHSEPNHIWVSNAIDIPSSSSLVMTDLSFFHVFGARCYPTNDNDDLGKLDAKSDVGIFIGYAAAKKAFRIYNKRTHKIIETIHVTFDELTAMASEQFSSGPGLQCMTPVTSSSGLVPNTVTQQPCILPPRDDWDHLFRPMFNEYFTPPPIAVTPVQEVAALRTVVLANFPVSTSIDQDAPSSNTP